MDGEELDAAALEERYGQVMHPLQYDEDDLQDAHTIRANTASAGAANVSRRKVMALQKEMQAWQTDLPCHPNAAVFIRQVQRKS